MATTHYWFGSWTSADETGLQPGQEHHWAMWGFGYGDAVTVSAHPVTSSVGEQILQVKDTRIETDSSGGRRLYFTVRNTGPVRAIGYGLGYSWVSA
jgi:hypothetical protein